MRVQELFQKDITREIKGVIKVEQRAEQSIRAELEEYVVTKELQRHFGHFYTAYAKSLDADTDEMGVWISGFFGSGKSHFLKILSYLLEDKEVMGHKALSFFEGKIGDPMLLGEMKRAASKPTDVLLFNIDSKSDADSKVKKDAIVKVFMRVFHDWQGYCGAIPWLAEAERQLVKRGVYEAFKRTFAQIAGDSWENLREAAYFNRDYIIESLVKAADMSRETAAQWFDNAERNYSLNIEGFAKMIESYCNETGRRIVFMVDEMGQYIGENSGLMLNLQTLTENLGTGLKGKAWIVVTSQEDIDTVTNSRVKGNDFSKIIGRFGTRIILSSANTDEVIKRRVLEKTTVAAETLQLIHGEKSAILKNLISFSSGTAEMKSYRDDKDFIETYPFVPYQFNLVQKVFEAIRKFGMTGKHLSEGERSMLSAFQGATLAVKDEQTDILVAFDAFYATVEEFLDTGIKRVFSNAAENARLNQFDLRVMRTLFMIKHIKEMPANVENLTTLMLDEMDVDKIALRQEIQASLQRLIQETLILQNGDEYYFLTDEEQEINREIKGTEVDERSILEYAGKIIFSDIYAAPKYSLNKLYTFPFNRQIDGVNLNQPGNDLGVRFLTIQADEYKQQLELLKMQSFDSGVITYRFPEDNPFFDEIMQILKIEKYIKLKTNLKNPENIQKILDEKARELNQRKKRMSTLLEQAIVAADVYACGEKQDLKAGAAKDRIEKGFGLLIQDVYRKLGYIKKNLTEPYEVSVILKSETKEQLQLLEVGDNRQAIEEVLNFIQLKYEQNLRITLKIILDRFTVKPYGWRPLDIAGLIAALLVNGEIKLQYNSENMDPKEKKLVDYLTKSSDAEKLVVQLKKKSDPETLNKARAIAQRIFNLPYPSTDEDALFDELRNAIQTEIQELQGYMGRYQAKYYPGKETVAEGLKLLKEVITYKDSASFLAALNAQEEALTQWLDTAAMIKGFFKNQVDKYDQGRERLQYYKHNLTYVAKEDESQEQFNKLVTIMEAQEPYGQIKDIPILLNTLDQWFGQALADKKQAVRGKLDEALAQVESELAQLKAEPKEAEAIKAPLAGLTRQLERAEDFAQADSVWVQCDQRLKECLAKIDALRYKTEPEPKPPVEGEDKPKPPVKPVTPIQVNLSELSKGTKVLETKEDVEEYVSDLKRKLLDKLEVVKKIRLI